MADWVGIRVPNTQLVSFLRQYPGCVYQKPDGSTHTVVYYDKDIPQGGNSGSQRREQVRQATVVDYSDSLVAEELLRPALGEAYETPEALQEEDPPTPDKAPSSIFAVDEAHVLVRNGEAFSLVDIRVDEDDPAVAEGLGPTLSEAIEQAKELLGVN